MNLALWSSEGEINFDSRGSTTSQISENGAIVVKAITLNKLSECYEVPDFVKVDIEGAEEVVFKSSDKLFASGTIFIVEIHKDKYFYKVKEEADKFGYEIQILEPGASTYHIVLRKK